MNSPMLWYYLDVKKRVCNDLRQYRRNPLRRTVLTKFASVHRTPPVCPYKATLCGNANQALFGHRKGTFNVLKRVSTARSWLYGHRQFLSVRASLITSAIRCIDGAISSILCTERSSVLELARLHSPYTNLVNDFRPYGVGAQYIVPFFSQHSSHRAEQCSSPTLLWSMVSAFLG